MASHLVQIADDLSGVRTLTLDRADVHNAFDERLIAELTTELEAAGGDDGVRVVVLTGAGKSFSAGADIAWMRRAADYDEASNQADARALARLMTTLDRLPKPVVARVNGAAIGGGLGLVACADIAIASERAVFATTEVRLGIVPAVISPFVVRAIGARHARRLFLTGERVDAAEAKALGLVHEVVPTASLDDHVTGMIGALLAGAPEALADAKALVGEVAYGDADDALMEAMALRIARLRGGDEAKDGLDAFLAKRPPAWRI